MHYFLLHKKIFLVIVLLILACIFFTTSYFDESIMIYAKKTASVKTSREIEALIRKTLIDDLDKDVISYEKDSDGRIISMSLDASLANNIMATTLEHLDEVMTNIDDDDLYVPIGYCFSDSIFFSYGPKVKLKLKPIGSYKVNILSNVSNVGINNSLVEIILEIKTEYQIMIPLRRENYEIITNIPLSTLIVQGEVPGLYYKVGS